MCGMLLFVLACTTAHPIPIDTGPFEPPPDVWPDVYALEGSVTWSLNPTNGQSCSYVATYAATEDLSHPWTCPECQVQFVADVSADDEACYRKVNGALPEREYLGFGAGSAFYRQTAANFPLDMFGSYSVDEDVLSIHASLESDDGSSLFAQGTLDRTPVSSDGWNGFNPPSTYACGWPKADPPAYEGLWEFHINQTIPDGWFLDTCGEPVRLHDLTGTYLVIDVSAVDCPPCQLMASEAHAFEVAMAKEGIDVRSVTLLAPSLSAILDDTPIETLEAWVESYGVTSPVLADRGWGYAILHRFLGQNNYPTWAVISPDLRSISIGSGFESYDPIENGIRHDLE